MKKYLLVCLLGFGTLLPTNNLMSNSVVQKRIIDIHVDGQALIANSGPTSGPIQEIQIYHLPEGTLVRTQTCGSYSCSCSLTGLPLGNYLAYVIAQNETGTLKFAIK